MHYKLVRHTVIAGFEIDVNRHIGAGYLPVGGLSVRVYTDPNGAQVPLYMQAMFHPEANESPTFEPLPKLLPTRED